MPYDFNPEYSTNSIWRNEDMSRCLTADLDNMDAILSSLQSGKANATHTHSEYAAADHTHDGYAEETHTHTQYALATDVDALEDKVGDTTVAEQISTAIASKADVNHTHADYAATNHTHTGYALESHEHTGYAVTSHSHSEYANAEHTHTGYASSIHTHSYNDLEDRPTIPTTLPANGGNADTVDGKHASEFATATDFVALQALVGDSSVSSQITAALENVDVDLTGYVTDSELNTLLGGKASANHTHAAATSSVAGFMSASDKDYIDKMQCTNLGNMNGKTIADLRTMLKEWIDTVYNIPGATLIFKSTDFIQLWNDENTTTTLSNGPTWAVKLKTHFTSTGYALLEVCGYYDKKAYYVALTNNTWGKMRQIAFDVNATTTAAGLMSAADKVKLNSIEEGAKHNVFSSLTELGITNFPTTMSAVASAMPANSMVVIDTRRVNGSGTDYDTQTISDWNNTTNGMALIMKGVTTARVTMLILYGSSESDHGDFTVGNYAVNNNTVSWTTSDDFLDDKVDKIINKAGVNLDTLIEPGFYYVSSGTTDLNFPIGVNGHLLVISDGNNRVRQVFMRLGTADTNCFQWYSRTYHSTTWSNWWLISGQEKIWNGGAVLGDEINIGSRYGCQSWVVVARLQNTGAMTSIVIPRAFLTNDTDLYKFQIADETCFISFFIYYKSDNDVYLKVVDQSDNEYTTLKYVYRTT